MSKTYSFPKGFGDVPLPRFTAGLEWKKDFYKEFFGRLAEVHEMLYGQKKNNNGGVKNATNNT